MHTCTVYCSINRLWHHCCKCSIGHPFSYAISRFLSSQLRPPGKARLNLPLITAAMAPSVRWNAPWRIWRGRRKCVSCEVGTEAECVLVVKCVSPFIHIIAGSMGACLSCLDMWKVRIPSAVPDKEVVGKLIVVKKISGEWRHRKLET